MTDEEFEPEPLRTDFKGLFARGVEGLKSGLLPMAALAFSLRDEGSLALLAGAALAVVIAALSFAFSFVAWKRLTYSVGASDIRVESGVLSRAARSVPYERIQDVSLEQKFVPRLLGLVEVRFETGAGGKDELKLAYLSEEEGERLRELVRERRDETLETGRSIGATGTSKPAPDTAETLFAMGPKRVVTFGLFEFSLAAVAVLGGAAQQFDFLLPFDIWDLDAWEQRLAGPGARLAGLGVAAQIVGAAIALAMLAALGFGTGLARTALREWNFRLERTPKGLRRRRGLLTRTDVVMPLHRVQALRLGTGAIRRFFGWHSLKLISLASDSGSANHDVAPFAQLGEIDPVVAATGFHLPPSDTAWERASARYRRDRVALAAMLLVPATLVAAVASWMTPAVPLVALAPFAPLAVLGMVAVHNYWRWRNDRHGLGSEQLYKRSGWLAPGVTIGQRVRLQSVEIVQGPLARRGGYASLRLGLAGGRLELSGVPIERARTWRTAILASMAGTDFSQLGDNHARKSAQSGFSSNFAAT